MILNHLHNQLHCSYKRVCCPYDDIEKMQLTDFDSF